MKHSKLPWKKSGHQIECNGHPRLVLKCENMFMDDDEIDANADFIVTACNEHDTLKAKAELLDEAVKAIDGVLADIADTLTNKRYHQCNEILSKAKELSNG